MQTPFYFCLIETSWQGTNQYIQLIFQPGIIETIILEKKLNLHDKSYVEEVTMNH